MSEEQSQEEPQVEAENSQGDPDLGDAGKRALASERRARAAAEKEAKALKAQLESIEAEKLSKEEKSAKEAAEARTEAAAAMREALRWRIAARYQISDDDVELFLTGTDEDTLVRQAERLKEREVKPGKGTHVPGVGEKPAQPPNLDEQIRAAEASGDFKTATALKTQKLFALAKQSR